MVDSPALEVAAALDVAVARGSGETHPCFSQTGIAAITQHATLSLDNFSVVPHESITAAGAISVFRWSRVTSIG